MKLQIFPIGLTVLLLLGSIPVTLITSITVSSSPVLVEADQGSKSLMPRVEALLPSNYSISVPFYFQTETYYCGPAALQMVFDYHGENVSQLEIADVARTVPDVTYTEELRRAVHFSSLSTSQGSEMNGSVTGYMKRKLGYGAFEKSGMSINDLRSLITQNLPVILLMRWELGQEYGHYRVAIAFNQTHIFLHDPWNKPEWGGLYGGPNLAMNYSFVDTMWDYSNHWALIVAPWKLIVGTPNAILANDRFEVTVSLTYTKPPLTPVDAYPASSCLAKIALSEGLALAGDENATKSLKNLQAGETAQTQWTLETSHPGSYSFNVSAEGKISGIVPERSGVGFEYSYQDLIGTGSYKITITADPSSSSGWDRIEGVMIALIVITVVVVSGTTLYYFRFRKKANVRQTT